MTPWIRSSAGRSCRFLSDGKLKCSAGVCGDVMTICDAAAGGAAWGKDDVILFAPSIESPPSSRGERRRRDARHTLDTAHNEVVAHVARLPVDGRHFVFSVVGGDRTGLHLRSDSELDLPRRRLGDRDQRAGSDLLGSAPARDAARGRA
jgi:hypothetical protein